MRYGLWTQAPESRPFSEKAWNRKALVPWDGQWQALSNEARQIFIAAIVAPTALTKAQTSVPRHTPPPPPVQELLDRGFVVIKTPNHKPDGSRVAPHPKLDDFSRRMRAVARYHLLSADTPSQLVPFVRSTYYSNEGMFAFAEVLQKAGLSASASLEEIVGKWVPRRYWPQWALALVKSPWAEKIVAIVGAAQGPLLESEIAARIHAAKPEDVRAAVDELVSYLVLFEDLRAGTGELVVDFLPAVRAALAGAALRRIQPPLVACPKPVEIGPDQGLIVEDLRSFLLEVASEPPRLKTDASFFAKEAPRFCDALAPQPHWVPQDWIRMVETRVNEAATVARHVKLVQPSWADGVHRLHITAEGQGWLGDGLAQQYAIIYKYYNQRFDDARPVGVLYDGYAPSDMSDDRHFLGSPITVTRQGNVASEQGYARISAKDVRAVRDSLFQVFEALSPGEFYELDSVRDHFSFDSKSPFNLGGSPASVIVRHWGRIVPSVEEEREQVARSCLERFIRDRLVPLGAMQYAVTERNSICIARTPRLGVYFGREGTLDETAAAPVETRVVVQPDFSVIVIGMAPAPAAALAPFCERVNRQAGPGAVVLKLTRESVMRAVGQGLAGSEIIGRLKQHASQAVPANVLREVEDWCGWVRNVSVAGVTVVRCDERATADRVISALGKRAERLGDTVVMLAADRLTPAERTKLQNEGILVQQTAGSAPARKAKAKKRRYRY